MFSSGTDSDNTTGLVGIVCVKEGRGGLQTAGGQSPRLSSQNDVGQDKGVCCVENKRLYPLLFNRYADGHPVETMDTLPVLIHNHCAVHADTLTHCWFSFVDFSQYNTKIQLCPSYCPG